MLSRGGPVPDSIQKLKQQLDQFRSARQGRARFPEALWKAAVEQARQHGVDLVAHTRERQEVGVKPPWAGTADTTVARASTD